MKTTTIVSLLCLAACGGSGVEGDVGRESRVTPLPVSSVTGSPSTAAFRGTFYLGTELGGTPILELDTQTVDYTWDGLSPGCGVPTDDFSVRWVADLELTAGVYRFDTYSDDGIRLRVDGDTVLDFWNDHGATAMAESVPLAGGSHHLEIEYYERAGDAVVRVSWSRESALPEGPGQPQEPNTPSDDPDLAAAQAFVADLTLGVNIERGWAWEVGGDYYRYLHDTAHATHVRLFYPWRPWVDMGGGGPGNVAPDAGRFARILDATQAALDAGLKVYLDCSDVIEDAEAALIYDHVRNCAQWVAERGFDPAKVAVGPINEHAGSDNPSWNPIRRELHAIMREALPAYVLTTGASGWKGRVDLLRSDFETFDDMRVIYEWHHYDSAGADAWAERGIELAAWRDTHGGRPTVCGECGPGFWDEIVDGARLAQAPWVWPTRFAEQLPSLAFERPSLWAVTYGGEYRLNVSGSDPRLLDDVLASFRENEQAIRAVVRP